MIMESNYCNAKVLVLRLDQKSWRSLLVDVVAFGGRWSFTTRTDTLPIGESSGNAV